MVERSPAEAYLTTGVDHHSVVIRGGAAGRTSVGYAGRRDRSTTRSSGSPTPATRCPRRSDIAPSTPDVLVLAEPGTDVPCTCTSRRTASGVGRVPPTSPRSSATSPRFSPSLNQIQGFYQDLLGFRWSDTIGDFFVFLRCNADHHAANFLESAKHSGMHHVAYEMRDLNHLHTHARSPGAKQRLPPALGPGRHGPGHNVFTYHRDPDGNIVELFTQLDVR